MGRPQDHLLGKCLPNRSLSSPLFRRWKATLAAYNDVDACKFWTSFLLPVRQCCPVGSSASKAVSVCGVNAILSLSNSSSFERRAEPR